MSAITATISRNGVKMNPGFELLSIDVTREFNKVPVAELKLIDGNLANNQFEILDGEFFAPGSEITVSLKFEGDPLGEQTLFEGIVTDQGLELNGGSTTLNIELSDQVVRMTRHRKNAIFNNQTDSMIIESLVEQNDLVPGGIKETTLAHPQMIQHYASDWDFALARAEANGQLLLANDGEVFTMTPEIGSADLTLIMGKNVIYDFNLNLCGLSQVQEVESIGWDIKTQKLSNPAIGTPFNLPQGSLKTSDFAKPMGGEKVTLVHPVPLHADELKEWANAQMVKSKLSFIKGWIKIAGDGALKVGQTLEIKGMSRKFSGKNIITGIRHQVNAKEWITLIQIGMDSDWITSKPDVVHAQAAGLLPGINGLQVGTVEAHAKDPENDFRVKVNIPAFGNQKGTVWARLASLDAGSQRGVFFRPEVGDEVVIGFLNDDPRQAIILGSMHSAANKPPLVVSAENEQKGICTKKNYQLIFDEGEGLIQLSTSQENQLVINETNGEVSIKDAHGNQWKMNKEGVSIEAAKDMSIKAGGDFEIAAKGKVVIGGKTVDLI